MSQVTPASLLSLLERAEPGFRGCAESDGNLFDRDSVHGLFAACSQFLCDGCAAPSVWPAVADLVNRVVGGPDADLENAACTCLLENLASRDHPLDQFLRGRALAYRRRVCEGVLSDAGAEARRSGARGSVSETMADE